jgi:lysophospholipase L1-like esterase
VSRSRSALGALLLLLASLALGECAARWIFPRPEISNWNRVDYTPLGMFGGLDRASIEGTRPEVRRYATPGPLRNIDIVWSSAPDGIAKVHRLNLYGFRGPDFPIEKPAGATRVIFLGDSFVEGFGAGEDETLPRDFARLAGDGVEVLNLGIGGADLGSYVRLARTAIPLLQPDVVILVLAWNDLPAPPPAPPGPPFVPERSPWWMPRLVEVAIELADGRPPALFYHRGPIPFFLPTPHPSNPLSGQPDDDAVDPEILAAMKRGRFNPFLHNAAALFEKSRLVSFRGEASGAAQIDEILGLAAGVGARVIAAYAPAHVTLSDVYYPLWNRLGAKFERPSLVGPEFQRERRHFGAIFAERGVPFVDPTDVLIAEEARGTRYFAGYDGHFNPAGYARLAELIFQAWRDTRAKDASSR